MHGCGLIHVVAGQTIPDAPGRLPPRVPHPARDRVRAEARVPTLVGGYLTTPDEANTIIGAGRADLCLLDVPDTDLERQVLERPSRHGGGAGLDVPRLNLAPRLPGRARRTRCACARSARSSRTARTPRSATDTLISVGICERAAARLDGEIRGSCCRRWRSASRATARPSPARSAISEETLRALVPEIADGASAGLVARQQPLRARAGRDAARSTGRPLLDLTRRTNARAAHRRVPLGLLPRGALRDVARARRPARAGPRRRRGARRATSTCPRRWPPGQTDFVAMGMDHAYCGAPAEASAEEGRETFETLTDMLVELVREVAAYHACDSARVNLATWFVDRHLEEGRGDRTALIGAAAATTYAELAALVNRAGHVLRELGVRQEERVLLALADGVEFVATWYAAQKIGAVTAEVYTFLPAKDFAYYLDYTRAGVVVADATTDRVREVRRRATACRVVAVGVPRSDCEAAAPTRSSPRADDAGRHRDLEVHDRLDRLPKACVHRRTRRCAASSTTRAACSTSARTTSCCRCRSCSSATRATSRRSTRSASAPRGSSSPSARRPSGSSSSSPSTGRRSSSTCRR